MNLFFRFLVAATLLALTLTATAQSLPSLNPLPQPALLPVPPPPDVDAKSYVLMDYATGRILASRHPEQRRAPASLTKLMTEYVVAAELKAGRIHLNDQVTISEHVWRAGGAGTDGSTSFLRLGSKVKLSVLLHGMIIQSGNDAAIALAEHTAGSEQAFTGLMNAYARQLGLTGTHFSDASGYPVANHYVTARDIAILARALIHDFPEDYAISRIREFEWNGIRQQNRNVLLWRDPAVDGIKTGYTKAAGYCLAASAKHDQQRMIAVVMGSSSDRARADAAMALLNYGFHFYRTHRLYVAYRSLATPRLWKGQTDKLPVGVTHDVLVTVKAGEYPKLRATIDMPSTLIAPFRKGQSVGVLNITLNGKPLHSDALVALHNAPQGGVFSRLWSTFLLWFHHDKPAIRVTTKVAEPR